MPACGDELSFTGVYHKEAVKEESKESKEVKQQSNPVRISRGTGGIGG